MGEEWNFCQDCGEEEGATKQRDLAEEALTRVETERLEAIRERDAYRAGGEKMNARLKVIATQLAESQQKCDRLRAALERYGDHFHQCDYILYERPCDCGLEAALKAKEEPAVRDAGKPELCTNCHRRQAQWEQSDHVSWLCGTCYNYKLQNGGALPRSDADMEAKEELAG